MCAADGSCDLVVDGTKRVHFGARHATRGPERVGQTEEIYTLMEDPKQGAGARSRCSPRRGEQYTLQGKTEYYIKVLP